MKTHVLRERSSPDGSFGAPYCSHFRVGGVSVEIAGHRRGDATLVSSLMPFRIDAGLSEINIHVEWVAKLPAASGRQLFDSGSVWRLYEAENGFQFDFSTPILGDAPYKRLLVDDQFCRASLLMSDECFRNHSAAAPLEYPLDEVLFMQHLI